MSTRLFPKVIIVEQVKGIEPSPVAWQATVLTVILHLLERVMGIEPTSSAWKADILAVVRHPHNDNFFCWLLKLPKQSEGIGTKGVLKVFLLSINIISYFFEKIKLKSFVVVIF